MKTAGPMKTIPQVCISVLLFLFVAVPAAHCRPIESFLYINNDTLNIGDPLFVNIEVENRTSADVRLPLNFFTMNEKGRTGLFFSLSDPAGIELANSCSPESPPDSDMPLVLAPGEFHGRKNIKLSECFNMKPAGVYSLTAIFTSADTDDQVWAGTLKSQTLAITVKESEVRIKQKQAAKLVNQWIENYKLSTAMAYRSNIASLGTPAVPAIIKALDKSDNYSMASDLLALLGELPCREAGDALIEFMRSADDRKFKSNVPGGFSASGMLSGAAIRSMEKLAGYNLMREKKMFVGTDVAVLWSNWWKNNRPAYPRAVPED